MQPVVGIMDFRLSHDGAGGRQERSSGGARNRASRELNVFSALSVPSHLLREYAEAKICSTKLLR
jgi:hypothetical protein